MTLDPNEDFASLFEKSLLSQGQPAEEGEIVNGRIIDIAHDFAIIDFGHKSEGQVPMSEFTAPDGKVTVKIGDEVSVYLETLENKDGLAILSKEKADSLKIWDRLQDVLDKDGTIEGVIVGKVKGGLSADIGVKAFLPASQIDVRPPTNLDNLMGRRFKFKILKLNKKKGNIIVSRRVLVEKDRDFARQETLQNIAEGQTVTGTIKNITDYGAFLDLGGVDGLLHITDMTWGRIGHPSELFSVGKDIKVKILKVDQESGKVSLGLKQLTVDPWENVPEKFPAGTRVKGRIVSVTDYGAFVELQQGVEGLIHISEMSWSRKSKHPSKIVKAGDTVEAVVLDMDTGARRISLGMKQILQNPWEVIEEKYPLNTHIKGPIKNVTDFGVFVGITDDIDGLVHVSDLSHVKVARPLQDAYPKGKEIEAVILTIDRENERISLGVKQLSEDLWPKIQKECGIGTRHPARIVWAGEKGIAVEMAPGVEGLVLKENFPEGTQEGLSGLYSAGKEVKVVIHSLDEKERRILLGLVLESGKEQ